MGFLLERREEVLNGFKGDIFPMKGIDDNHDEGEEDYKDYDSRKKNKNITTTLEIANSYFTSTSW